MQRGHVIQHNLMPESKRDFGQLVVTISDDQQEWYWLALHQNVYSHFPLSRPVLAPTISFVVNSGLSTLFDRTDAAPRRARYDQRCLAQLQERRQISSILGPQCRQIRGRELARRPIFSQDTGQSNNPLSPHYGHMIAGGNLGVYSDMNTRTAVKNLALITAVRNRLDDRHGN